MPKSTRHRLELASIVITEGGDEEFCWRGEAGEEGAVVFKTDRFGQRWTLDIEKTHWITQRVAAGLLGVSVMAVNNWIRQGKIKGAKKRAVKTDISREGSRIIIPPSTRSVSVIPFKEIRRIAESRGDFLPPPELTPEQRARIKAVSFNRKKKGGEKKNADQSGTGGAE